VNGNDANDVVQFLTAQHNDIKKLFTETLQAPDGTARDDAFFRLRRLLAVHETAEELIVHPLVRKHIQGGNDIVVHRLLEEREAKEELTKLEDMDVDAPEFIITLSRLHSAVLAHAHFEERDEFAMLRRGVDAKQLEHLTAAIGAAQRLAPTRAHAGVESGLANLAAGPFTAMVDWARDAIRNSARDTTTATGNFSAR
jgi:hemerythrin superfamily protein